MTRTTTPRRPPAIPLAQTAAKLRPWPATPQPEFLLTREARRFVEFADTVRANKYIGTCTGAPGTGKTLSARVYSGADAWEEWSDHGWTTDPQVPTVTVTSRTAMWTPQLTTSPRELECQIPALCQQVSWAIERHDHPDYDPGLTGPGQGCANTELLIIDEADRLKTVGLEQVRDFFDRHHIGIILIGMPGLERRLARYPQLYSRIGFAHHYAPLAHQDLQTVLAHQWTQAGTTLNPDNPQHSQACAAIARITGGNFRLIDRLFGQIRRLLEINNIHDITPDVIEAARETLVIGT